MKIEKNEENAYKYRFLMVRIAVNHQLQTMFYCLLCDRNMLLYWQVCRRSNNSNSSKTNMLGFFKVWLLQNLVFPWSQDTGNVKLALAKGLATTLRMWWKWDFDECSASESISSWKVFMPHPPTNLDSRQGIYYAVWRCRGKCW